MYVVTKFWLLSYRCCWTTSRRPLPQLFNQRSKIHNAPRSSRPLWVSPARTYSPPHIQTSPFPFSSAPQVAAVEDQTMNTLCRSAATVLLFLGLKVAGREFTVEPDGATIQVR